MWKRKIDMSREVRRVPADWEHTKEYNPYRNKDCYKPLYDGDFKADARYWDDKCEKWEAGERPDYAPIDEYPIDYPFDQWEGPRPYSGDYMPQWDESERTHYMMYETTSEGTPISPAFDTPEDLARWLADTNASAFAGHGASYDAWLRIAKGGYAPSAIMIGGQLVSGVEGVSQN
jgi:hypothetical protein